MKQAPSLNSYSSRDPRAVLHPYTNLRANEADGAFVIARGDGIHVYDEDGREYIEAMAGLWCASLGFANARLAEAAARQMRRLGFYHGFNQKSHPTQIALAERLLAMAPVPMARVFFTNSGSEAIDTAIKLIWYYNNASGRPAKKKLIGRARGYHGITLAATSLTGVPANHAAFDAPLDRFLHADCPHYVRDAEPGESEEAYATRLAERLDALIRAEGPETVAAFFAEPIMGAGGVILPPAGYFAKVQEVLRAHDVLFVVDEVICGFGRTGNMWGSDTYDLRPDMVACAKALSSGHLPIAALLVNEEIYRTVAAKSDEIGVFAHGYTYSGHPVAAAVALETLAIYDEIDLLGHVRATAPHLQDGIRRFADHPLTGEIDGIGMVAVAELVDPETRQPFPLARKVGPYLAKRAESHGLIVRALGDRVGFSPPLIITPAEIREMYARFARALDETLAWVTAN